MADAPDQIGEIRTPLTGKRAQLLEFVRAQHPRLWEGQLENRIVWNVIPVDQVVDDVRIYAERQHERDQGDRFLLPSRQDCPLRDFLNSRARIGNKSIISRCETVFHLSALPDVDEQNATVEISKSKVIFESIFARTIHTILRAIDCFVTGSYPRKYIHASDFLGHEISYPHRAWKESRGEESCSSISAGRMAVSLRGSLRNGCEAPLEISRSTFAASACSGRAETNASAISIALVLP
jgi:hypothetical protein